MKPQEQLLLSRRGAALGLPVPTAACEGGPVLPTVVSSLDATMWVWRVPGLQLQSCAVCLASGRAPPACMGLRGGVPAARGRPVQLCTLLPSRGQARLDRHEIRFLLLLHQECGF